MNKEQKNAQMVRKLAMSGARANYKHGQAEVGESALIRYMVYAYVSEFEARRILSAAKEVVRREKNIITHRCGHRVDYNQFSWWQSAWETVPPSWERELCDDCEDARSQSRPFNVVQQRRESGEWAGDR